MTAPDEDAIEQSVLKVDSSTGDISVRNLSGNTVVFDSFSDEVKDRTPSAARKGFNVHVSGNVATTLSPSMVHAYRVVDCQNPPKATPAIEDTHKIDMAVIDDLHADIARQKQRCAELLSSPTPVVPSLYPLCEPGVAKPTTKDITLSFDTLDATLFSYPMQVDLQVKDAVPTVEKATAIPKFDMPTVDAETTPWPDAMPLYPIPCYPSTAVEPNKRPKSTFAQVLMCSKLTLASYPPSSSTEVWPSAFLPHKERIAVSALQELERSHQ